MIPAGCGKAVDPAGPARIVKRAHQIGIFAQVISNSRGNLETGRPLPHFGLLDKQGFDRMRLEERRQRFALGGWQLGQQITHPLCSDTFNAGESTINYPLWQSLGQRRLGRFALGHRLGQLCRSLGAIIKAGVDAFGDLVQLPGGIVHPLIIAVIRGLAHHQAAPLEIGL